MLVPLAQAESETCGGKAAALGALMRAGLPVPDGFVVPFAVHRATIGERVPHVTTESGLAAARAAIESCPLPAPVIDALERGLDRLGDRPVAVRSSAANEDTTGASAAGQYDTVLAVHGVPAVADALRACWASLFSSRATAYRRRAGDDEVRVEELAMAMAVIVQRHLDAEVAGVTFTPSGQDGTTVIESAWGLGPSVVAGSVTPDTYRVGADKTVTNTVADKRTRLDRVGTKLLARDVPVGSRTRATLDHATSRELAALGEAAAEALGGPQDIEWAIADGRVWLLQSRPITTASPSAPPPRSTRPSSPSLTGTPGSHGSATGTARTVRGPRDFTRVQAGDILICPYTDPAWTPLLAMAAGVVTATGGALSHAAIVARERGIPAVLGVAHAIDAIPDGTVVTIDGTAGTVTTADA